MPKTQTMKVKDILDRVFCHGVAAEKMDNSGFNHVPVGMGLNEARAAILSRIRKVAPEDKQSARLICGDDRYDQYECGWNAYRSALLKSLEEKL